MTLDKPFVQIVIVTWNKKSDIVHLLGQLQELDYPSHRFAIVVVDNDSNDGTVEAIELQFPQVQIVRNATNLGGAGGFNAGMRWALEHRPESEFLWLLDNDVLVDPHALSALVNVLDSNPTAGMCGSKIINRDDYDDVIELGAFVDYEVGDVRRNLPASEKLADPHGVFAVDYVAACSLLVRTDIVRKIGIWYEDFFIYWDDMEWGVRFNANGYKVLAANSSKVYHPSWAGRTVDNSAIWRTYYRTRNGLCFFNNYTSGMKRRLLLSRLILRYSRLSFATALSAHATLAQAVISAVKDFSKGAYGKKDFTMPPSDIRHTLDRGKVADVCLFIIDPEDVENAKDFLAATTKKYSDVKTIIVAPWKTAQKWDDFAEENVLLYNRPGHSKFLEKIRVVRFLRSKKWSLLLTGARTPKIAAFWGREVVSIDFSSKRIIAIEKFHMQIVLNALMASFSLLLKVLFFPPAKNLKGKTIS